MRILIVAERPLSPRIQHVVPSSRIMLGYCARRDMRYAS